MSQILKPSNLSLTWASAGDVLNPGNTKYATGWQVEIPPRQWFNYIDNRQDTAIAHINQHGVAVWDAGTEYQADKSYVQGSTNGTIYRCVQTHTNQDPETDIANTYWIVAFASAGDFYTKAEVDGAFLSKAANGSDILNAATFCTNISVYSKAQTYTKSEVDAKTTVASTPQAQAWSSNTTLITPLRLAEAFQGVNQSLAQNGYQKFPGGFFIQFGTVTSDVAPGASIVINLPIAFPVETLNFGCTPTQQTTNQSNWKATSATATTVTFTNNGNTNDRIRWYAYGR